MNKGEHRALRGALEDTRKQCSRLETERAALDEAELILRTAGCAESGYSVGVVERLLKAKRLLSDTLARHHDWIEKAEMTQAMGANKRAEG